MKAYLLIVIFFANSLISTAELSKDELKRLQDVEIAGTRIDTWKNDDREKFEVLEVNTNQNQDDTTGFRIRLAVELTDNKKNRYLVEFTGNAPEGYDSNYEGEDYWQLRMAYGDLGRPKITGFAVQYGIMDGEAFIPLAEEFDDVKTFDELTKRTTTPFPNQVRLWHYYMFDDQTEGSMESTPSNVRAFKE
jgi:hypothetical protein